MEENFEELKVKYESLAFENHVLKTENMFMKQNIQRIYQNGYNRDDSDSKSRTSLLEKIKRRIRKIIK